MMDAIVQLLRNGLCCIKDLELLQDTFLWDASYTGRFYHFEAPLNKTTPLEVFISIFQFYAFCSASSSGYSLMMNSIGKILRINRIVAVRKPVETPADRIINASLVKEGLYAIRSMIIGFLVLCIGISFIWLTANSWHVTETDWIGGLPGLIHSLSINELCLLPLVYLMLKDGGEQVAKASRMKEMAKELRAGKVDASNLGLSSFEMLTKWLPFWDSGVSPFAPIDTSEEEKLMTNEIKRVNGLLDELFGKKEKNEKEEKIRVEKLNAIADEIERLSTVTKLEGYREYLYFVLNFIAFYGYLMSIIVYYFPEEAKQPPLVKRMLLNMTNETADWRGNFAGDFMWTIEPMFILGSPLYLETLKASEPKKVKAD